MTASSLDMTTRSLSCRLRAWANVAFIPTEQSLRPKLGWGAHVNRNSSLVVGWINFRHEHWKKFTRIGESGSRQISKSKFYKLPKYLKELYYPLHELIWELNTPQDIWNHSIFSKTYPNTTERVKAKLCQGEGRRSDLSRLNVTVIFIIVLIFKL